MFELIPLPELTNAGHIEFFDLLHAAIAKLPQPHPAPVQSALAKTTAGNDAARRLHKQDKFIQESEKAREADGRRDRYTGTMARLWSVLADFPPGPLQEAGAALERNFRLYGTVHKVTLQDGRAETTDIKRILEDQQSKPELRAALGQVPFASPLIEAIESGNSDYTRFMGERLLKEGSSPEAGALKTLRDNMREPYAELLEAVWSFYISTEKSEPWAGLVRSIEALHNETRQRLSVKEGRAEAKAEKANAAPDATV
ncbi:MAG: hypothetical protein EOO12_01580 [Chitinophagaceae bacterium]|nr:MAG: hypothetical protein EOO12_01580 [Chitinophagaceae bacterium]